MTTGSVRVVNRHRTTPAQGLALEIDPRLPASASGRVVYHCDGPDRFIGPAHQHSSPHEIACLAGTCHVAYRPQPDGPVEWHRLEQGGLFTIAGGAGHRIRLDRGSVVGALSPALTWLVPDTDLVELSGPEWESP